MQDEQFLALVLLGVSQQKGFHALDFEYARPLRDAAIAGQYCPPTAERDE
jgi:hypothetical protein